MRESEREQRVEEIRKQIVKETIDLPFKEFLMLAVDIAMDRKHNQEVIANLKGKDTK